MITDAANKLKRFPPLAESLSESEGEEEEINLESDEPELSDKDLFADGSVIKHNSSNNMPAMVQGGTFVVAEVYCTSQN